MRTLVFTLVLVTGQFGFAEDKKDLPDKIIKAWKDAGATVGWMKLEADGSPSFVEWLRKQKVPQKGTHRLDFVPFFAQVERV
jgi:hypothetical protein